MQFFIGSILVGISAGAAAQSPVLVGVSLLCLVIVIGMAIRFRMEKVKTMIAFGCALVGNAAMWVTFYVCTNQTWFGDLIHLHIIRT